MKTNHLFRLAVALITIVLCGFQYIEDPDFLDKLKAKLTSYNSAYPEEKIYLQFDKPFYKPGEDIWFNAFVLNSNSHKPTDISEVLYVDLSDPKGNTVAHLELVINDGMSKGDFKIAPEDLGGIYHVQAYTNWMKNFGIESSFRKDLQVQRVITPRLLLKLDYEKEAYGPGDNVVASLTARNLKNELLRDAQVNFTVSINGRQIKSGASTTDSKGNLALPFVLPDSLNSTDGLLQLVVTSNGTRESISRSIPIVLDRVTVDFYPEGGNLIQGTESRLAFKAVNEYQKAADIRGVIIDEKGNTVTRFSSFHMGMGTFTFTPIRGKKYYARVESTGKAQVFPLPEHRETGFAMRLSGRNDSAIEFLINAPGKCSAWVVGQSHGTIFHSEKITLNSGANPIKINTEEFPAGVAVFTLFNHSGQGLCERLVSLNSDKQLNIEVKPDKERYMPGEKVELQISTTDKTGKPVPARLSLSVADDQIISFADDKQDNLLSAMLLSSEVKGEVQEPAFYFDQNEPKASEALDNLLMTQGWRRFKWTEIENPTTQIAYEAERVKTLSGVITNESGQPASGEVTLVELGNRKRVIKVQTTSQGEFSFKNTDPTVPLLLLTNKRHQFNIDYDEADLKPIPKQQDKRRFDQADLVLPTPVPVAAEPEEEAKEAPNFANASELDVALTEDVQSLSEVVVVGYSTAQKKEIVGSVTVVEARELENISPLPAVENHLQGRVAGVIAQPKSATPGAASQIRIRGISSLAGGGAEPLFIIDGHPIGTSINYNFSNSSVLGADDIQSITVYHSPEATALFGSEAVNGAIVITTKSGVNYSYHEQRQLKKKFASVIVQPRKFSVTREFYNEATPGQKNTRTNFNTTVYWNPDIQTNAKGLATVSFINSDAVSAFRITAEGIASSGLIGRRETVYSTLLPMSADAKLPAYLGFEDVLSIPVRITNETKSTFTAAVQLETDESLGVKENTQQSIAVKPGESATIHYTITSMHIAGNFPIKISVDAEGHHDEIAQTLRVQPVGYPMHASFSGKELERNVRFRINDAEAGTIKAELSAFPDVLGDLFTGAEGIFRQPYGCFEQTSSSTFPNILALQYLQRSGLIKPETEKVAIEYIQSGYKRLVSYEVRGGGFEWFGKAPAHEALTAYGLIEFSEMKKVYPQVDDKLIARTRQWLLSRRKGDGTFALQSRGLDDFSRPSGDVSNAYITYALSETGEKDLDKEYLYNLSAANSKGDMYLLALLANIAHNLGRKNDYERLIYMLNKKAAPGFENMTASHSVVWSQGLSLTNETVALWALALMKDGTTHMDMVSKCIDFLVSRRSDGMFGSTQATVLSLKALAEYAVLARSTEHAGEIQVFVNQILAESLGYEKNTREKILMTSFARHLTRSGDQKVKIIFNDTPEALPYSVNVYWHSKTPASNEDCKVRINTVLSQNTVKVNETVRLTASVTNRSATGLPMTMAVIGIPAGLSAQPWQLKEMQEKEVFDFYEINDGYLYVYYRQMQAKETRRIQLDLKAEIPGTYTAAASSAYLYYTNEYKDWVPGTTITIHE